MTWKLHACVYKMASPGELSGRVTSSPGVEFQVKPKRRRKERPKMPTEIFKGFYSDDITDEMLADAAKLFSENYGVWGTPPPGHHGGTPGERVKMRGSRLRSQCLPAGADCSYVSVTVDGILAGNVFACRWDYQGRQVCWVTQLVVHRDYRERRLATRLLEKLRDPDDEIFGIMSSHPAACIALSKACAGFELQQFMPLEFAREHAAAVMAASPITYVKDAEPRGLLFTAPSGGADGLVSAVNSNFFVDHDEPLAALEWLTARGLWPLGELRDGHEFLLVFETSRRRRSRSQSLGAQSKEAGRVFMV
ncbi:hypothetical protein B0T22DRAFT_534810 [Podospora appendiculata]|uniref:N-acetyltransferase domain-containing protein n=1 Tax=Podospora appendiculata TaxID=314037 RepID=A0AAE0X7R1_9PEZI|nr:hypothetical protein B0T22DRAFT_534810 [Podospora appendiculata]